MKKYLLLLHEDIETMQTLSPKDMEELINAHLAWADKLGKQGRFLGGDGLEQSGKLIQGKNSIIKDGPYIEAKEMIGGYYLVEAENLEEAVALAQECPCHLWGGTTEVRPIMDYEE